jgi:rare lipoprotein A
MKTLTHKPLVLSLAALLMLTACSSAPRNYDYADLAEEVHSIKTNGGVYKVGTTYTALGQTYTPREDYNYSETGMASWYGKDFHNKKTANGETYDMRAITAAHRTLPLPSIVRVTNLENGRSIIARVNDRGPYVKNRIIDLSEKGAELLGYKMQGTAKVKVEILEKESRAIKEAMLADNNKSKLTNNKINYGLAPKNTTPAVKTAAVAAPQPAAVNQPIETGTFFVQVGAFSDLTKAKEMANNMQRFGTVTIHEAYLSKDGVYRVRLGAYHSRDEALQILDRVLDYGHADVSIVEG